MNPVIILIGGGTGSGKSTLASNINGRLSDFTTLISMDDYYKDQSAIPEAERELINYDSPEVVDIELLSSNIAKLRRGEAIDEPIYDFATHTRKAETTHIESSPVIIVEGIMALRFESLRSMANVKLYVDVDDDERIIRRILRDTSTRSRNLESIVYQYRSTVKPMHQLVVDPTKKYADFILQDVQNMNVVNLLVAMIKKLVKLQ
jgi:uridine kinase